MSETSSTLPTFSCNSANTCNTVESAFLLNPTKPIARLVLVLTAGAVGIYDILGLFMCCHIASHFVSHCYWLLSAHPSPAVASCHWPQLASPCSWPKQPKHPKLRHQKCLKKCWWDVGQNSQTLWASLSNKWLTICLPSIEFGGAVHDDQSQQSKCTTIHQNRVGKCWKFPTSSCLWKGEAASRNSPHTLTGLEPGMAAEQQKWWVNQSPQPLADRHKWLQMYSLQSLHASKCTRMSDMNRLNRYE